MVKKSSLRIRGSRQKPDGTQDGQGPKQCFQPGCGEGKRWPTQLDQFLCFGPFQSLPMRICIRTVPGKEGGEGGANTWVRFLSPNVLSIESS